MKIAKIINDQIFVDEHTVMFPEVAFPPDGTVPQPFMEFHNLYEVVENIDFDPKKQRLTTISPKLLNNKVYIVEIINKTDIELRADLLFEVREKRNALLKESDVYVMSDRWDTYTVDMKKLWSDYRQKLRDLPEDFSDRLDNIFWPTLPPV